MITRTLTHAQQEILRPYVQQFLEARAQLNNQIIMAVGEEGWALDLTTLECTKPESGNAESTG